MGASTPRSVLVVGAGPVGLTLAALLLGRGDGRLTVRLIDSRPAPRWDEKNLDLRVYALSRASQRILEHIGVWKRIAPYVCPYQRMRVWEGREAYGFGSVGFDAAEIAEPDLGVIVEDSLLRSVLLAHLGAERHFRLDLGTELERIEVGVRAVTATTASGDVLRAELVAGADGSASRVRSLLGLPAQGRAYGQAAVAAHVAGTQAHQHTAWQRFLPTGPLAFLPLRDGRSSIVWSTDTEHAQRLLAASDEAFLDELNEASAGVLGRLHRVSLRASFPLRVQHVAHYCSARIALLGDAAHTVHPLAGQGMNLGFLDAAALAAAIEQSLDEGQDPSDLRSLRRYERRRKGENLKMLLALDALHHLFRLPRGFALVRELGLGAVDRAVPAKHVLMRSALGLCGDLPPAARAQSAQR
jgi:2-octaprenylphenol hydroxylase